MDDAQPKADELTAVYFRAEHLARRTVEYHRVREAEHRSRERFGRRFTPFPWSEAAAAVLSDEALEDEDMVVALIRELGRQGCSEVALAALDMVVARGSPPASKAMFDAAILVCATEYQDQRCLDQYERMRALGLVPDLATGNLVLSGLCCRGRLGRAVEMLGEMRMQLGLRPNSFSVLMVLQACNYKRRGAYREAIDAVQALEAGGRTANEEVIEALLQVCEAAMHQAPSFEAAVAVFQALSELHLADSTRVYNGLLGAAGRAGRWREAQALYAQMQEDDVPASLETHTALIQACVVGRALDHALDIFEHLVAGRSAHEAVPASIATYNHLIHACHQAGMLEKALEIASWVQKTGVEFDDETYGELMATIDVAQLWDDKAMKQARQKDKAVLPQHLRPAPYDAMRVMYLDHLEMLQQEELLAMEKLGGQGSWAPRSLTRGGVGAGTLSPSGGGGGGGSAAWSAATAAGGSGCRCSSATSPVTGSSSASSSARSLARAVPSAVAASDGGNGGSGAGGGGGGGLYEATSLPSGGPGGGGGGGSNGASGNATGREPVPSAAAAVAAAAAAPMRASTSSPVIPPPGGGAGGDASAARSRGGGGSRSPSPEQQQQQDPQQLARAASVKQLLRSLSTRPLPALGAGTAAAVTATGGLSFRASSAAPSRPAPAPTGFHEPPTWAQLQTLDAATAGPGGTPFSLTPASPAWTAPDPSALVAADAGGGAVAAASVPLAVEPSNLFGQASGLSVGTGAAPRRISVRGVVPVCGGGGGGGGGGGAGGGGGGGSGLRVVVTSLPGTGLAGGPLPPLSDPLSPGTGAGTAAVAAAGVAAGAVGALSMSIPSSPRGLSGGVGAAGAALQPSRPSRPSRTTLMGRGSAGAGVVDLGGLPSPSSGESAQPSPLPAIVSGPGVSGAKRFSVTALAAGAGKPVVTAAAAGF